MNAALKGGEDLNGGSWVWELGAGVDKTLNKMHKRNWGLLGGGDLWRPFQSRGKPYC